MAKNPAKTPPKRPTATLLKEKLSDARRVALVGIGSRLRGDDAAGLLVAESLERSRFPGKEFKTFIGDTAPENITGEIKRFKPDHILLVDAADFKEGPGTTGVVEAEDAQGICFCTHQIPLQILADYLFRSIGCCVTILGIQAKSLHFGSPVTKEVEEGARSLAADIAAAL